MNRELIILAVGIVALLVYHDSKPTAPVNAGTVGAVATVPEATTTGSEQTYTDPLKQSGLDRVLAKWRAQVAALPGVGQ